MKKEDGFARAVMAAAIFTIVAITGVSLFTYSHKAKNTSNEQLPPTSCELTERMKASSSYDVPCSLLFTLKGPPYPDQDKVQEIIKPTNGALEPIDAENGVYAIKVRAGTEKGAIDYLKSRPEIDSATQDHCCATAN